LDGGHIVICLYEIITGRKPGDKFILVAQMVGMVLLVLLMLLAFGNDIGRLLR
jgi:regulator of sigma E protease